MVFPKAQQIMRKIPSFPWHLINLRKFLMSYIRCKWGWWRLLKWNLILAHQSRRVDLAFLDVVSPIGTNHVPWSTCYTNMCLAQGWYFTEQMICPNFSLLTNFSLFFLIWQEQKRASFNLVNLYILACKLLKRAHIILVV